LFAVRVEQIGAGAVVWVTGQLDMSVAEMLEHVLLHIAGRPSIRRVVVDFEGVTFLDPSGLRALVAGYATATAAGVAFTVRNAAGMVARVLDATETAEGLGAGPQDGDLEQPLGA
jgi:anti-anti-sigma factor